MAATTQKTPITYYGGKQKLLKQITSLLPYHKIYCEPFIGGGAVFWAKKPAKVEIINDINRNLIDFYDVLQNNFDDLKRLVENTLHSRSIYHDARLIYEKPRLFDKIKRAWAVWVLSCQSYSSNLGSGWAYDNSGKTTNTIQNKIHNFRDEYSKRLQSVQIECLDALRIIKYRDSQDTFFYLDPPYYNSDMGHYNGYTKEMFTRLLELLSIIKGKFLLSSYPSMLLTEHIKKNGWYSIGIEMSVAVSIKGKKKVEVLTSNYPISLN